MLNILNGGINEFARGVTIDFQSHGVKINTVSPRFVENVTGQKGAMFPGHIPAPMNWVANGFRKSVEGVIT